MQKYLLSTDGACSGNPGPGGWGLIFYDKQRKKFKTFGGFELHATNNSMELMAMLNCFELIIKHFASTKSKKQHDVSDVMQYKVLSDSAYVVNSLLNGNVEKWQSNGWKIRNGNEVKNAELWKKTYMLFCFIKEMEKSEALQLELKLVRGHNGNVMNELADMEAVSNRIMASFVTCDME